MSHFKVTINIERTAQSVGDSLLLPAIRVIRAATDGSLREAKDAAEAMGAGEAYAFFQIVCIVRDSGLGRLYWLTNIGSTADITIAAVERHTGLSNIVMEK
jgi:ABC-type spermidine/putrescine transport system permease subunit II